jgi:hypothetical protein
MGWFGMYGPSRRDGAAANTLLSALYHWAFDHGVRNIGESYLVLYSVIIFFFFSSRCLPNGYVAWLVYLFVSRLDVMYVFLRSPRVYEVVHVYHELELRLSIILSMISFSVDIYNIPMGKPLLDHSRF